MNTLSSRASSSSCSSLYILPPSFRGAPAGVWGGGKGCALQCGLLVNYGSRAAARLAWAGVGASGSGTGRSGHRPRRWRHEVWDESEHQPGVWSIPHIPSSHGCLPLCVCMCVRRRAREGDVWRMRCVCMFIRTCVHGFASLAVWAVQQHQCRPHPNQRYHDIWAEQGSERAS